MASSSVSRSCAASVLPLSLSLRHRVHHVLGSEFLLLLPESLSLKKKKRRKKEIERKIHYFMKWYRIK